MRKFKESFNSIDREALHASLDSMQIEAGDQFRKTIISILKIAIPKQSRADQITNTLEQSYVDRLGELSVDLWLGYSGFTFAQKILKIAGEENQVFEYFGIAIQSLDGLFHLTTDEARELFETFTRLLKIKGGEFDLMAISISDCLYGKDKAGMNFPSTTEILNFYSSQIVDMVNDCKMLIENSAKKQVPKPHETCLTNPNKGKSALGSVAEQYDFIKKSVIHQQNNNPILVAAALLVLFIAIIWTFSRNDNQEMSNSVETVIDVDAFPVIPIYHGESVIHTSKHRENPLSIRAPYGDDKYYIKIKDVVAGDNIMEVYVEGGGKINVEVPEGTFEIQ